MDFDEIPVITLNTVIVGAGAAGLNAADRLFDYGQKDIAVVCETLACSTSRNAGSDKQTYYKLSLSGREEDSVRALAKTLYDGKCVDGDIALCEAALSAQCFIKLAEMGVPFPTNRYGEAVGYKTDNDPKKRASSAGPFTSRYMVECLLRSVNGKGIPVYEGMQAISIITEDAKCLGILCLTMRNSNEETYILFHCSNVIWATGGPAGMYGDSAYPPGHTGSSGIVFEAGAAGKNLTEWQFGMASLDPRWNVSGSFMQVLPRFLSTEYDGGDEREFLRDHFKEDADLLNRVFLKGYQWPFDVKNIKGSSMVDLLVFLEINRKGRRVYLDFSKNAKGFDFSLLSPEAADYLKRAGAGIGTPAERLCDMNRPAYDFYFSKGVDLKKQPIEIAVCAQHNNGGIAADCWWQTCIEGLFAVGEACGSHGVSRPGGSALNAGQVGSMRAAQYISRCRNQMPNPKEAFLKTAKKQTKKLLAFSRKEMSEASNLTQLWEEAGKRMNRAGGPLRDTATLEQAAKQAKRELESLAEKVKMNERSQIKRLFQLRDMLISQQVYLFAMLDYVQSGGMSRGSALYREEMGTDLCMGMDGLFSYSAEPADGTPLIQEVRLFDEKCFFSRRPPRDIPLEDDAFETVWKKYQTTGGVY